MKKPGTMTNDELTKEITAAASMVKLVCGVGNNAAWYVVLDAYDRIKHHPRYNQPMPGGHRLKWYYERVFKAFKAYENRLIYAKEYRMFCVSDMAENTRKKYGDITDREYYEFWAGIGATAYQQTQPLITSLWNKYRLSLLHHNMSEADSVAWVMTGLACLELACKMYDNAIISLRRDYHIPEVLGKMVFNQLNLRPIADLWRQALKMTEPNAEYPLDQTEERNIIHGLQQLNEAWMNPRTLYRSTFQTVIDYDDVFRTKGEQKKAMKEISKLDKLTEEELTK